MRDTIDMAREAGFVLGEPWREALVKRFAELVRADEQSVEREACWRLCDALWIEGKDAHDCREAIRARGNT